MYANFHGFCCFNSPHNIAAEPMALHPVYLLTWSFGDVGEGLGMVILAGAAL